MRYSLLLLTALSLLWTACDTTVQTGPGNGRILPNITGGAGEVLVVVDKYVWESNTGEAIKDILQEEFPGLPQSEPLFDVTQITSASFDKLFRFHRSVVLVTINETVNEPAVRYRKNVWAKPQIVVQVEAGSNAELEELIGKNDSRIQNFLVQYDRQRLTDSYNESKDLEIQQKLAENHHLRLGIPRGYNIDFLTDSYSSFSIETPEFSQVIQVYEYPADSANEMTNDYLVRKRDNFTEKYVKGPGDNSYMITSDAYPPIFYDLTKGDKKIVECRGLWELEGGYMGGPFVSHSIYDAKRSRVVAVDGYVYYPNQKKRIKIKQLEAIIYSLEII